MLTPTQYIPLAILFSVASVFFILMILYLVRRRNVVPRYTLVEAQRVISKRKSSSLGIQIVIILAVVIGFARAYANHWPWIVLAIAFYMIIGFFVLKLCDDYQTISLAKKRLQELAAQQPQE